MHGVNHCMGNHLIAGLLPSKDHMCQHKIKQKASFSFSGNRIRGLSRGIVCCTDNSVNRLASWRWKAEWDVNM